MRVVVACVPPGNEAMVTLDLADGATVADAVAASGLPARLGLDPRTLSCAIHGQRAHGDTPLAEGDRVELLLPLRVDPQTARRLRARAQRAEPSGAKPRTGGENGG